MGSRLHRTAFVILLIWILAQPFSLVLARTKPRRVAFDRDYASALATADRFLHAWQTRDAESGLLLLTDHVRQHTDEERVHDFFSSGQNPSSSFEIGRGKKLSATRYEFPVALFFSDSNHPRHNAHPQASALIVVRMGHDDWAIDKLP